MDGVGVDGTGVGRSYYCSIFTFFKSSFVPPNFRSENLPIRKFTNFCHKTGQSPISSPPMIPGFLNRPQAGDHGVDGVHMALVPASPPLN